MLSGSEQMVGGGKPLYACIALVHAPARSAHDHSKLARP